MDDYLLTFEQSYSRVLGDQSYTPAFIDRFYEIFTAQSDVIAEMFRHTSMSAQKTMLHDSLNQMVEYFSSHVTTPYMQRIARVHGPAVHDVPVELYDIWLDSLVRAVSELDAEFDDEVELAWRLVLAPGITYMKFMRDRVPPRDES